MRVLVAGDPGSIGAVLTRILRPAADGSDVGLSEGCALGPLDHDAPGLAPGHIRDVQAGQVDGHDAVIGLGPISNHPLGHLDAETTHSINVAGTLRPATASTEERRACGR